MVSGPTKPRAVLIGPPGSGKSTIGRRLAKELGVSWHDTDEAIAAGAGSSISDIFVDHGEAHFRELEEQAVERALLEHTGVLALGGGAVLSEATRRRLASHRVLYLEVGLTQASRRVGLNAAGRPLLLGNVRSQLKQMLDARTPLYREVADLTVNTDDLDVDAVVDAALDLLEQP